MTQSPCDRHPYGDYVVDGVCTASATCMLGANWQLPLHHDDRVTFLATTEVLDWANRLTDTALVFAVLGAPPVISAASGSPAANDRPDQPRYTLKRLGAAAVEQFNGSRESVHVAGRVVAFIAAPHILDEHLAAALPRVPSAPDVTRSSNAITQAANRTSSRLRGLIADVLLAIAARTEGPVTHPWIDRRIEEWHQLVAFTDEAAHLDADAIHALIAMLRNPIHASRSPQESLAAIQAAHAA